MKLTPIKVRGKRRPRDEGKAPDALVPREPSSQRPKKRKTARTMLYSLPLEILERIFFESENLNLPRASPLIGRRLSGHSTLVRLVIAAFGPTWNQWFGVLVDEVQSYSGWELDDGRIAGNPDFQTEVLACPWADLYLVLEACDQWYRKDGQQRHYQHVQTEYSGNEPPPLPHALGGHNHVVNVQHCFDVEWLSFKTGKSHFWQRVLWDGPIKGLRIEVHPETRMPDRLFYDPLDEESIRYIFWLFRAGAGFTEDQSLAIIPDDGSTEQVTLNHLLFVLQFNVEVGPVLEAPFSKPHYL